MWQMLICALRVQVKKLNIEVFSLKLCIQYFKRLKIYLLNINFSFNSFFSSLTYTFRARVSMTLKEIHKLTNKQGHII